MSIGNWGSSGELRPGQSGKVQLQSPTFPYPELYTVQFGVMGRAGNAVAEIDFSLDGNTVTRKINIRNGTLLTGIAKQVKVRAFDESPPAFLAMPTPYIVTIHVGRGSRPSGGADPELVINPIPHDLRKDGPRTVILPDDVGANTLITSSFSGEEGGYRVEFYRRELLLASTPELFASSTLNIPPGATHAILQPPAEGGGAVVMLSLGIVG